MIRVESISKHFGGLKAVNDASIQIESGAITGLIGPNGAGKTTLFNIIAGVYQPTSGKVFLDDEDITGLKPHQLFGKGLLRTFQIAHEFSRLTVLENLMMVPGGQMGESITNTWFKRKEMMEQEKKIAQKAREVMSLLSKQDILNMIKSMDKGGNK